MSIIKPRGRDEVVELWFASQPHPPEAWVLPNGELVWGLEEDVFHVDGWGVTVVFMPDGTYINADYYPPRNRPGKPSRAVAVEAHGRLPTKPQRLEAQHIAVQVAVDWFGVEAVAATELPAALGRGDERDEAVLVYDGAAWGHE